MSFSHFCQRNRRLLVTSAVAAILSGPALAQETGNPPAAAGADADSQTLDTVVVVGQRAMIASAINMQRNADTVDSVLTREGIGQFPDQNVAESIRRLPGSTSSTTRARAGSCRSAASIRA